MGPAGSVSLMVWLFLPGLFPILPDLSFNDYIDAKSDACNALEKGTPPEFDIVPEKWCYYFPFWGPAYFQGIPVGFRGVLRQDSASKLNTWNLFYSASLIISFINCSSWLLTLDHFACQENLCGTSTRNICLPISLIVWQLCKSEALFRAASCRWGRRRKGWRA